MPHEFSSEFKRSLREFYPDKESKEDPIWGHPADTFVSEILTIAAQATSALYHMQGDTTSEEKKLEYSDLLKTLKEAEAKLRGISLDLERLLPIDADTLGCADQIGKLLEYLNDANSLVVGLPRSGRPEQKFNPILKEMTAQILSLLSETFEMNHKSWVDPTDGTNMSDTVKVLKLIGDEIGLGYSPNTWRKFIDESRKTTPPQLSPKNGA